MIDWNALIIDPVVQRLSEILRVEMGVMVGYLDKYSRFYLIENGSSTVERSFAEQVYLDTLNIECALSRRFARLNEEWLNDIQSCLEGSLHTGNTQGSWQDGLFSNSVSWVVPLIFERSESCDGAIVATGFMREGHDAYDRELILDCVPEFLRERYAQYDDPLLGQLNKHKRDFVQLIVRHIAHHIHALAARGSSQQVESDIDWIEVSRVSGIIGQCSSMQRLFGMIKKVARSNSTVLIEAENGTGKELVARAIHTMSPRREAPFVALNCAAIAHELIASELFGHVKGAFSGAHRDRTGLFESAHGGTLFLDEIGDMDIHLQVKLLRVLQEGTFTPVGGNEPRRADVRIICATNKNLQELVDMGRFREDLYYRIRVISLSIPPLRERRTDIPLLTTTFIHRAAKKHGFEKKSLSESCTQYLMKHHWPGNVRELENEIERLVIMSGSEEEISDNLLNERIKQSKPQESDESMSVFTSGTLPMAIEMVERKMILESLKRNGWNKSHAAKELGVSRRNLIRKVAHYGFEQTS